MWVDIEVVTPPAFEPVDLVQLKTHANLPLDDTSKDAMLQDKIEAARVRCEKFTRRSLITQTLDIWYDSWDGPGVIEDIPRGKVQEIVEIACYDDGNVPTIVDPTIYTLSKTTLIFATWIPYFRPRRGIRLRILSGYGDYPEDVPAQLREGILQYAAFLYDYRLGEGVDTRYASQDKYGGLPQGVYDKWISEQIKMV